MIEIYALMKKKKYKKKEGKKHWSGKEIRN